MLGGSGLTVEPAVASSPVVGVNSASPSMVGEVAVEGETSGLLSVSSVDDAQAATANTMSERRIATFRAVRSRPEQMERRTLWIRAAPVDVRVEPH